MPVKSIKIETAFSRASLATAVIICIIASVFIIKWCFANAIAVRAPAAEVAELSVALAPNDPQTHYALAVLNEKNFLPENLSKSLAEFEQAVALSPNDFRLWLALGKARERRGDAAGAELALRRAIAIAPNYSQIQWTLGNVLLRRGKIEEAFIEIRRAAEGDQTYRNPALATARQIFGDNAADIKNHIGGSPNMDALLALFLAGQKQFDEAVKWWDALPVEDKKTIRKSDGENLFGALIAAKKYQDALRVYKSFTGESEAENYAVGKITNGGFEADVKRERASIFEWQIADGAQPQIGFDDVQKHGGSRSLVIVFNSNDGKDFRQISQTVVIGSAGKYVLDTFYKSNLKTPATLRWEIVDAADGKVLGTTEAILNNADWTNLKTEFAASENTQAVTLRLVRQQCKSIICPISGKIWFDDFSISQ
jgi:tetratricopeptide (TPR) repeat protein